MEIENKLLNEGSKLVEDALDALSEFEATGVRDGFREWVKRYGRKMDQRKIQKLILVLWERAVKSGEIGGQYPYAEDAEFCKILKGCEIDPNELDCFLTPSGLK